MHHFTPCPPTKSAAIITFATFPVNHCPDVKAVFRCGNFICFLCRLECRLYSRNPSCVDCSSPSCSVSSCSAASSRPSSQSRGSMASWSLRRGNTPSSTSTHSMYYSPCFINVKKRCALYISLFDAEKYADFIAHGIKVDVVHSDYGKLKTNC